MKNGKKKIEYLHDLLIQKGFDKVLIFGRTKWGIERSEKKADRETKAGHIDSYIHAGDSLVAAIGLSNLIIVETKDALLVAAKDRTQEVKTIVNRLKMEKRKEVRLHKKVFRPWGSYEGVDCGERFQVKRIIVNPGATLSLQRHFHRAEHWVVVKGTAHITNGDQTIILTENQSTYIPLGTKHRLENPGTIPLEIIEVQTGSYLGEDDIERYDDLHGW